MSVVIIDYGAGNIQSIKFALERLGTTAVLTNNANVIREAAHVIFPGVGEASTAMEKLISSGLDTLIPTLTQPVLGICLGMQLMCNRTAEGNTKGLGIFDTDVVRFDTNLNVPHMGWNTVEGAGVLFGGIPQNSHFYLVHSYYAKSNGNTVGSCTYGIPFAAALAKNNFYGTQFHPEKSGEMGAQLLKNFLAI
ncbi:MAG: imidazole glycerol phosphate synthase subunit HisH [Flavobacteriaceae bacterium]|nr:imidazole glycerol phosphate synthase subunit HisH [Flavobacteriaceae bacterium]